MSRYGIGEWFGRPITELSPEQRRELAAPALGMAEPPPCPFRSGPCSKKGGVCSLQRYGQDGDFLGEAEGAPVIVCPARFDQDDTVVRWLADIVGIPRESALVAREVPFMAGTTTGRAAGKIDLVVAQGGDDLTWFGLEIQAVYFSGPGMAQEFLALRDSVDDRPPYPLALRRPDWRSSSAKRLMPQLEIKGPTLRRWGTKIAVAVDRPFFEAIGGPTPEPSHDLSEGDVIWLVPELSGAGLHRGHWEVLTLEASSAKLLAATTVRKQDFQDALLDRLRPVSAAPEE